MEDIKPWEGGPWVPLMNDSFIGWQHVPIESIRPDPASVHVDNRYSEPAKSFDGLVASIAQCGMADNIIVSKVNDGDYLIIDGVRRFRAASRLGFSTLMSMVYGPLAEGERADLRAQIYFRGRNCSGRPARNLGQKKREGPSESLPDKTEWSGAPWDWESQILVKQKSRLHAVTVGILAWDQALRSPSVANDGAASQSEAQGSASVFERASFTLVTYGAKYESRRFRALVRTAERDCSVSFMYSSYTIY